MKLEQIAMEFGKRQRLHIQQICFGSQPASNNIYIGNSKVRLSPKSCDFVVVV